MELCAPAGEGDLVSSEVDVRVRKDLRQLLHEPGEERVRRVDDRVDRTERAVRLVAFVAGGQEVGLTETPRLCMACQKA